MKVQLLEFYILQIMERGDEQLILMVKSSLIKLNKKQSPKSPYFR